MFSMTTIASSTTKPVAMVSAISVRLLIEKPARYMTPNVPTSDSGTATLGMSVAATLRRNRKMTSTTSATASSSSNWTSATEPRIVTVRSVSSVTSTAAGNAFCSCGNSAFTRSTTSMTLVPGWRWMLRMIAGRGVGPRGEPRVLGAVDRVGDVLHAHRRAVLVGDDELPVFVGGLQLIVGVDRRRARRAVEAALGLIGVGVDDRRADVVERQPVRGERLRIDLDAHGGPLAAADAHQPHAGKLRDLLRDPGVGRGPRAWAAASSATSARA